MEVNIKETLAQIYKELLKIDEDIDRDASFFQLGGQSILANKLQIEIKKRLSVKVSLKDILKYGSVNELAEYIESKSTPREEVVRQIEMTRLQKAYVLGKSDNGGQTKGSKAYVELSCNEYDEKQFINAVNQMIDIHEMLRTKVEGQKLSVMSSYKYTSIDYEDLSQYSTEEKQDILEQKRRNIFAREFKWDKLPLFYLAVSKMDEDDYLIHFLHDGIIMDGWSETTFIKELELSLENKLQTVDTSFSDYVEEIKELEKSEEHAEAVSFWKEQAKDFTGGPSFSAPIASKDGLNGNYHLERKIDLDMWDKIQQFARNNDLTPFALVLTIYAKVLSVYSIDNSFEINVPVSMRPPISDDIDRLIGMCSSFFLFHFEDKDESMMDMLHRAQDTLWDIQEHLDIEGNEILDLVRTEKQGQYMAPVVFTSLTDIPVEFSKFEKKYEETFTVSTWLETLMVKKERDITISFEANKEVFDYAVISSIADLFVKTLRDIVNRDGWEKEIELLDEDKKIYRLLNGQDVEILEDRFIDCLNKSIEENSERTVIASEERVITYRELPRYFTNVIEQIPELAEKNCVAIMLNKSWKQAVLALTCAEIGVTYIPLEEELQTSAIEEVLKKTEAKLLISEKEFADKFNSDFPCPVVYIEDINPTCDMELLKNGHKNPVIINTSGTSGIPKSILLKEESLVNCFFQTKEIFGIGCDDCVLSVTNFCHDMSIFDVLGMPVLGAKTVYPDKDTYKEPKKWLDLMEKEHVTVWNSVPAFMEMLLLVKDKERLKEVMEQLRVILLGGDWIRPSLAKSLIKYAKNARIYSVGGPSETTIWNIYHEIKEDDLSKDWIPYGTPFPNTHYYILNENRHLCPVNVIGEMGIGGVGVSEGYLGNEELTNSKYVDYQGERIYLTGDQGMLLPNGEIRIMGRADNQVKINGKRVELEGIEQTICKKLNVKQCVVLYNTEIKRLNAVLMGQEHFDNNSIRKILESELPYYMIPVSYRYVDEMPITRNGKLDRRKLMELFDEAVEEKAEATDAITQKVMEIYRKVMKTDNLRYGDNFFANGGNSISAMEIAGEIEECFGVEIFILDILESNSMYEWVDQIKNKLKNSSTDTTPDSVEKILKNNVKELLNKEYTKDKNFIEVGGTLEAAIAISDNIKTQFGVNVNEFDLLAKPYLEDWVEMVSKLIKESD
jgi:amino acid adenylation domain-containing protein